MKIVVIVVLLKNLRSPFDGAQGEREGIDNLKNFPFMLVEAFLRVFQQNRLLRLTAAPPGTIADLNGFNGLNAQCCLVASQRQLFSRRDAERELASRESCLDRLGSAAQEAYLSHLSSPL